MVMVRPNPPDWFTAATEQTEEELKAIVEARTGIPREEIKLKNSHGLELTHWTLGTTVWVAYGGLNGGGLTKKRQFRAIYLEFDGTKYPVEVKEMWHMRKVLLEQRFSKEVVAAVGLRGQLEGPWKEGQVMKLVRRPGEEEGAPLVREGGTTTRAERKEKKELDKANEAYFAEDRRWEMAEKLVKIEDKKEMGREKSERPDNRVEVIIDDPKRRSRVKVPPDMELEEVMLRGRVDPRWFEPKEKWQEPWKEGQILTFGSKEGKSWVARRIPDRDEYERRVEENCEEMKEWGLAYTNDHRLRKIREKCQAIYLADKRKEQQRKEENERLARQMAIEEKQQAEERRLRMIQEIRENAEREEERILELRAERERKLEEATREMERKQAEEKRRKEKA
jgi:hypothetical protein